MMKRIEEGYEQKIEELKRQIFVLQESNKAMRNLNHVKTSQTLINAYENALKNDVYMTLEQFIEFMALSHWNERSYSALSREFVQASTSYNVTAYDFYEAILDILRNEST